MATTITDRRRACLAAALASLLGAIAGGCVVDGDDDDSAPWSPPWEGPAGTTLSDEIPCADPFAGPDRFLEEGEARGLTRATEDTQYGPVYFLTVDLDDDGDIDLVHSAAEERRPLVFLNDGSGFFAEAGFLPIGGPGPASGALGAADVDDDGLPEIFLVTSPSLWRYPNLGDGQFGAPTLLHQEDFSNAFRYPALSIADADGDGDLDVAMFRHEPQQSGPGGGPGEPQEFEGTDDLLLILENGSTVEEILLPSAGGGTLTLAGTFTDRDGDGDQDLLIPSDRDLPLAFWRNDGGGTFVDDAADIGASILMDGMGLDSADLNGDGLLDYCITDTGNPVCLVSNAAGGLYTEGGLALGLIADDGLQPASIGWSFDFGDYDDDGHLDAAQVSGPMFDAEINEWPDLLWFGTGEGGFREVSTESGFDTVTANYGLASADFDGDGSLDLLRGSPGVVPSLWMNRCGGGWIEVELVGPDGNRTALGSQIAVTYGDRTMLREVNGPRGNAQTPARIHFGLGDVRTATVHVNWPDDTVLEIPDVPARHRLRAVHPDAR